MDFPRFSVHVLRFLMYHLRFDFSIDTEVDTEGTREGSLLTNSFSLGKKEATVENAMRINIGQ